MQDIPDPHSAIAMTVRRLAKSQALRFAKQSRQVPPFPRGRLASRPAIMSAAWGRRSGREDHAPGPASSGRGNRQPKLHAADREVFDLSGKQGGTQLISALFHRGEERGIVASVSSVDGAGKPASRGRQSASIVEDLVQQGTQVVGSASEFRNLEDPGITPVNGTCCRFFGHFRWKIGRRLLRP